MKFFKYLNKAFRFIATLSKYTNAITKSYETFKSELKNDGVNIDDIENEQKN